MTKIDKMPKPEKQLRDMYNGTWTPDAHFLNEVIAEAIQKDSTEPLHAVSNLKFAWERIADKLEQLPIQVDEGLSKFGWMFFVLAGGKWFPAVGHINEEYVHGPALNYRIVYADGSVDGGTALPGQWAYCTADKTPSIPYLFGMDTN